MFKTKTMLDKLVKEFTRKRVGLNSYAEGEYVTLVSDMYTAMTTRKEVYVIQKRLSHMLQGENFSKHAYEHTQHIDNFKNNLNAIALFKKQLKSRKGITAEFIYEMYDTLTYGIENHVDNTMYSVLGLGKRVAGSNPSLLSSETYVEKLVARYNELKKEKNVIETAVFVHNEFLKKFSFFTIGNTQTALYLLNFVLMENKYLPLVVTDNILNDFDEAVIEDVYFGTSNLKDYLQLTQANQLAVFLDEIKHNGNEGKRFPMLITVNKKEKVAQ